MDIVTYLAIDDGFRDVEFTNHAKRDGSSAWLGVVHLTLEEDSVNSFLLGKDLGGASARRSSSDNSDLVLHFKSG